MTPGTRILRVSLASLMIVARLAHAAEGAAPVPLWPGAPPRFAEGAPPETVDAHGRCAGVSVPSMTAHLPPAGTNTGMAIVVCPGGGYGGLDWTTHVVYAAQVFNPMGVAVIGLKYRTRPPNGSNNDDIRAIALLDAKRANDGLADGAPIELPRAIEAGLKALGVPVRLAIFDVGAHGVGNLIPQRVRHGFPPAKWPELLVGWLGKVLP